MINEMSVIYNKISKKRRRIDDDLTNQQYVYEAVNSLNEENRKNNLYNPVNNVMDVNYTNVNPNDYTSINQNNANANQITDGNALINSIDIIIKFIDSNIINNDMNKNIVRQYLCNLRVYISKLYENDNHQTKITEFFPKI